ncbi:MAG: MFS transporter [Gemmatimonadales bacterium]
MAPRARAGALNVPAFRIFFVGYVVSLIGVWMQRTAQAWLVVELTDSPFYVGLVDALGTLPVLLFSLYAGAVADRVSRYRMVFVTQTFGMLLGFAFAIMWYSGNATITLVALLAAGLGIVQAFDIPARHSFFFDLVGREHLPSAIALNSSAFNGTRAIGPSIAGVLIGAFGVGICFLLNGVTFLAVLGVMLVIRKSVDRSRPSATGRPWNRIVEGLRYVNGEPRLRRIVFNIAASSILSIPVLTLMPVLARSVLEVGAREFGWMMSAVGLGALGGALVLALYVHELPKGRVLAWSTAAFGLLVALVALSRSLPLTLVLLAMMGAAMIIATALTNTLIQSIAPDEFRARVVSVYTVAFVGMAPIGAFAAGTAAEMVGTTWVLTLGGLTTGVVAWLALGRHPGVVQL